jgi:gamma-glutamylcyclotransferase (GGCT)/AIG2-like uncharacterized protein YtfP
MSDSKQSRVARPESSKGVGDFTPFEDSGRATQTDIHAGSKHLLFVYGTLLRRSPHPMAKLLAEQARFVGQAKVHGRLYDLGRFPGMTAATNPDDWVYGDVYDLDGRETLLAELDAYEELESPRPSYFDRQLGEAMLDDGASIPVAIYWYRGEVKENSRIASGRYLA